MARKRVPVPEVGPNIRVVLLDTTEFDVIGPDHEVWKSSSLERLDATRKSFIRIIPPPSASDEDIERVKRWAMTAVPVMLDIKPRPKTQVVTDQATPKKHVDKTIRQVVEAMLDEANSKNPAALKEIGQEIMAKVGL
jgi:hypothetical protein